MCAPAQAGTQLFRLLTRPGLDLDNNRKVSVEPGWPMPPGTHCASSCVPPRRRGPSILRILARPGLDLDNNRKVSVEPGRPVPPVRVALVHAYPAKAGTQKKRKSGEGERRRKR